jgi:putative transposase
MLAEPTEASGSSAVPRTIRSAAETGRPTDPVNRDFTAQRSNQLWVADLTCVRASVGWVHAAFSVRPVGRTSWPPVGLS